MNKYTAFEHKQRIVVEGEEISVAWRKLKPSSNKIVMLLHGGPDGNKDGPNNILILIANNLSTLGIDTVRFDFRGQGESQGDYIRTTMKSQQLDFNAVFSEVQKRGYDRIGIAGESLGATCALGVYKEQFTAMALLWPAIYLLDGCFAPLYEKPYKTQFNQLGYIKIGKDKVGANLLNEIVEVNNFENKVREITVPTLLIHGDADSEVSHTQSERAFCILPEPKKMIIVPSADHGLRRPHEQEIVIKETAEWFNKYL